MPLLTLPSSPPGRGLGVSSDASLSSLKRDLDNRADLFVERTIRAKRNTREVFESLIAVGQHENAHRIAMGKILRFMLWRFLCLCRFEWCEAEIL